MPPVAEHSFLVISEVLSSAISLNISGASLGSQCTARSAIGTLQVSPFEPERRHEIAVAVVGLDVGRGEQGVADGSHGNGPVMVYSTFMCKVWMTAP